MFCARTVRGALIGHVVGVVARDVSFRLLARGLNQGRGLAVARPRFLLYGIRAVFAFGWLLGDPP